MPRPEMHWAQATLWGIAAMAGAGAFGIVLRLLGVLDLADPHWTDLELVMMVAFVMACIPTVIMPILVLRQVWLLIIALCIMLPTPFALAVMTTVQPFGPIRAMALAEVRPPGGIETGIRITDAAPRRDLARNVTFSVTYPGRRGSTTSSFRYQVAPVVHAQWVPGMPVAAWAVVAGTAGDPQWDAPAGALLRPIERFKAERAARHGGLPAAATPVIGLWVADAGAARLEQVTLWGKILGGASLAWALLAWLGRPTAGARVAPGTGPRPPWTKFPPRWKRRQR